ncbi:MAG: Xaa-Pro peptidase family protein [Thermodesulfovibrionales bacterium]|nr:Xaa-Pro peptidase family protein [Thermodesulfovibrionales bacterium]
MKLEYLHNLVKKKKIDAFLVSNIKNIKYLTNFSGSSAILLVTKDSAIFITDFRYREQALKEVKGWQIITEKGKRITFLKRIFKRFQIKKVGFETAISYHFFENLKKIANEVIPFRNTIEQMRQIKTVEEIRCIKKAIEIAESSFLKVKPYIKKGVREIEIANKLESEIKNHGSIKLPFDIIVASGKNSAMPHARPTDKTLNEGDFVIIDWGAEYNGYFSDMTRTFIIKDKDLSKKCYIYEVVNEARKKTISKIISGVKAKEIDKIAREFITSKDFGKFFGHATGHGIGLDVHEAPSISKSSNEKIVDSMVFTIEPGIYLKEIGGVRIEDIVVVKEGKADILTTLPTELEIIN